MYRIAMIGGRPAPVAGAKEMGIDVVLVHEEGKYDPKILEHCERVVHAPITDGPAMLGVLKDLHAERPFDRVMTTTEPAGVSTGYLVDALGLPGVTEATARALLDKSIMRELLDDRGLSPVRHRVVKGVADIVDFQREVGGPIIVKPTDGVASLHIHPVSGADDAPGAWAAITEAGMSTALAEEYLQGPVVSVDSISRDGRHVPIGYSEYRMNEKFVEWEVSTPSRVAVPYLEQLRDLTPKLLDAVGLTEGPSHSEFVLTPDGPRVLESHARLAGSGAPELVRRAFGYDLNRMMMTVPLGIDPLPDESPDPIAGAVAQFLIPQPGRVVSVSVDDDIPAVVRRWPAGVGRPGVFLPYLDELRDVDAAVVITKNPGDTVPPLNTVVDCESGYVLVTGTDGDDAVRRADEIVSKIHIETA